MKQSTVNGKSLRQVEEELAAPFPESAFKQSDVSGDYLPVKEFEDRLDSVVGRLNYDRVTEPFGGIEEVCGSYVIRAITTITVYDDDREKVVTKTAQGGYSVIIVKETGKPKELKSDVASAGAESFKNCAKLLGIGVDQIREKAADRKKGRKASAKSGRGEQPPEAVLQIVRFKENLTGGNGYYKALAENLETGEELYFMLFSKQIAEVERRYDFMDFVRRVVPGTELSFLGYVNTFQEKRQVVFVAFGGGTA